MLVVLIDTTAIQLLRRGFDNRQRLLDGSPFNPVVRSDATTEAYTKAIVDYIKGGKPMDEYPGFKVLARQIHPHTGGGALMVARTTR